MTLAKLGYAALVSACAISFVLGSANRASAFCFFIYKPVCAVKGGMNFTYANACFAMSDGAKIIYKFACLIKNPPHMSKKKM